MKALLKKILWTLGGIFVYRLGTFITIPFVDSQLISSDTNFISNQLFRLFAQYSVSKFDNASIFALGLSPYISASIICQAVFNIIPEFIEQKKREGQTVVSKYTKNLTLPLILLQGSFFIRAILSAAQNNAAILEVAVNPLWFTVVSMLSLMVGTLFLIYLGEIITTHGLGSGTSILLAVTCFSSLSRDLDFMQQEQKLGLYLLILFVSIMFITAMETAQRQIPLLYPQTQKGLKVLQSFHTILPIKINQAGVIPPIFAGNVLAVLTLFLSSIRSVFNLKQSAAWLQDFNPLANIALIMIMSFIYTDIIFHPEDIANYLQRPLGVIPTIRPGLNTAQYIKSSARKLTLVGGLYVSFVTFAPELITKYLLGINQYKIAFSGSSLLIVVVVVIEIISKINTQVITTQTLHSQQLL
jgi:preprotein translocase subunit SecY